ncbi:MAG: glycosyltransferase family 4 protein [Actinomycetota bacterium]|nr:glycosyltransferase family 4 protein [Actinomycetota bacterium]
MRSDPPSLLRPELWTPRRHVLVTNDFPPKIGGIQSYLYEIYRRLPADKVAVITTSYPGDQDFDSAQRFPVLRTGTGFMAPTPRLAARLGAALSAMGAQSVALDPALPLGLISRRLPVRPTLVVHGAEAVIPASLPILRGLLTGVLRSSAGVVSAGRYTLASLESLASRSSVSLGRTSVVEPGVDSAAFIPPDPSARVAARLGLGIGDGEFLLASLSRLVPRKGMDVLIRAHALARREVPGLRLLIAGEGRDRARLERVASRTGSHAEFLGRVPAETMLALYQGADLFAMLCRNRWMGLEQEGFGIVFLEAAACGVPQLAGRSGGSAEAVEDGVTGYVIDDPRDPYAVARRILELARAPEHRAAMGEAARTRAVEEFDYELLARRYGRHFGLF